MPELLQLFISFFKIGAVTFGGGYAMLPMFEREAIENKHWITHDDLIDIYAASQSLPGAIAINASTFIGSRVKGAIGAVFACLGMIFPSLIIILLVATVLNNVIEYTIVQNMLKGMSATVIALILNAGIKLGKRSVVSMSGLSVSVLALALITLTGINVVFIIIAGAVSGAVWAVLAQRLNGKKVGDGK